MDFCGCMGPQYGEPYCPCEMKRRGLPRNEAAWAAKHAADKAAMAELFGPGGRYHQPTAARWVKRFAVRPRPTHQGRATKPEALALSGLVFEFTYGWEMGDTDPYPGEVAWLAPRPGVSGYPADAPLWIASGDLEALS